MKLLVGLGNPGNKYLWTRHNAGFILLDLLAAKFGVTIDQTKFDAFYTKLDLWGKETLLIKPQTFMNLSGRSVAKFMTFFKTAPQDVIVLHDDLDLASGSVKTRMAGGAGGHNGIRSILAETGAEDFKRIKIGIGKPDLTLGPKEELIHHWVLTPFGNEEAKVLQTSVFDAVIQRLEDIWKMPENSKK